jgi:guanylate kinase
MRDKLLRRTRKQRGSLSQSDRDDIEVRAASAWHELHFAHQFQHVIPNHDGEDSDHWGVEPVPSGDAGKSLEAFVALLRGEPAETEHWTAGTLA